MSGPSPCAQRVTSGSPDHYLVELVLGFDSHRQPNEVKVRIGVQLQASAYFERLTLREILDLFGHLYPRRLPPDDLLKMVGLEEKGDSLVDKLSGGQRQRFTIAAAMVNDPDVVFLDEPTTGLDPQARRSLWDLVQEINRMGRTVVLTTHYMEEAQALCDRVAIMDRGQIVALDTPQNLIMTLPTPYQVRVQANGALSAGDLGALDGVLHAEAGGDGLITLRSRDAAVTLPALVGYTQSRGLTLERLEVSPATLEDVFLALTGRALRD